MRLEELQTAVDEWIRAHGGYWGKFEILARLTEEVGEVAAALQRVEGLRPSKDAVDLPAEVGDVLFTLAAFANANGIRLDEALRSTLSKYTGRDGSAWDRSAGDHE